MAAENVTPRSVTIGHSGIQYGIDENGRPYWYDPARLHVFHTTDIETAEKLAKHAYTRWFNREYEKRNEFNRQIAND